jgi:hypothetical protein
MCTSRGGLSAHAGRSLFRGGTPKPPNHLLYGEQKENIVEFFSRMARRPDEREKEMLSEENLKELRHRLAHLRLPAVREFYETAYRDCRLIYNRLPTPKQIQTLVQVWKQLWKWR